MEWLFIEDEVMISTLEGELDTDSSSAGYAKVIAVHATLLGFPPRMRMTRGLSRSTSSKGGNWVAMVSEADVWKRAVLR